ncbi:hypothetical protein Tsubulata_048420, partial [Turnera subulata]
EYLRYIYRERESCRQDDTSLLYNFPHQILTIPPSPPPSQVTCIFMGWKSPSFLHSSFLTTIYQPKKPFLSLEEDFNHSSPT